MDFQVCSYRKWTLNNWENSTFSPSGHFCTEKLCIEILSSLFTYGTLEPPGTFQLICSYCKALLKLSTIFLNDRCELWPKTVTHQIFQKIISLISISAGRLRRRYRQESSPGGLNRLLKTVAPTCTELVASCQTGTGAIVRGDQCCQILFQGNNAFRSFKKKLAKIAYS